MKNTGIPEKPLFKGETKSLNGASLSSVSYMLTFFFLANFVPSEVHVTCCPCTQRAVRAWPSMLPQRPFELCTPIYLYDRGKELLMFLDRGILSDTRKWAEWSSYLTSRDRHPGTYGWTVTNLMQESLINFC